MKKMFFIVAIGPVSSRLAPNRRPVATRCDLPVADADKTCRSNGEDLTIGCQMSIWVKCKVSGEVFMAQREAIATQGERRQMTAPQNSPAIEIVEEWFYSHVVSSKDQLLFLRVPDRQGPIASQ